MSRYPLTFGSGHSRVTVLGASAVIRHGDAESQLWERYQLPKRHAPEVVSAPKADFAELVQPFCSNIRRKNQLSRSAYLLFGGYCCRHDRGVAIAVNLLKRPVGAGITTSANAAPMTDKAERM